MADVLSLKGKLEIAKVRRSLLPYQEKIAAMDKLDLLEEMVRFNETFMEEESEVPPLEMILKGIIFFETLSKSCETAELKHTTEFYHKILQEELRQHERLLSG